MTHVTCRLTAKNRLQLRNPTLGYIYLFTLESIGKAPVSVRARIPIQTAEAGVFPANYTTLTYLNENKIVFCQLNIIEGCLKITVVGGRDRVVDPNRANSLYPPLN